MAMFTSQEAKDLTKFLSYAENQDEALSLDGLHGFLFGLAGIPGLVAPNNWLPGIFGEGMREVDDEKEGTRLIESLFSAYVRIVKQNQNGVLAFPFGADRPRLRLKIGRNDSCPCGSGAKYKKCCGK